MVDLYQGAKGYERFFFSRWRPSVIYCLNLGLARLLVWGPYPFISLTIGWRWCFQMYLGIKCDGSRTTMINNLGTPGYVMVLTLKELAAVRIHTTSPLLDWNNQGGQ